MKRKERKTAGFYLDEKTSDDDCFGVVSSRARDSRSYIRARYVITHEDEMKGAEKRRQRIWIATTTNVLRMAWREKRRWENPFAPHNKPSRTEQKAQSNEFFNCQSWKAFLSMFQPKSWCCCVFFFTMKYPALDYLRFIYEMWWWVVGGERATMIYTILISIKDTHSHIVFT